MDKELFEKFLIESHNEEVKREKEAREAREASNLRRQRENENRHGHGGILNNHNRLPNQEELQQELQEAIRDIIEELELEGGGRVRHRRGPLGGHLHNNFRIHTNNNNNNHNNNNNTNINRGQHPIFRQRRPWLRTLLRNLLVIDYFLILMIFPFSMYNVLRSGFSSMTYSDDDFISEIMNYIKIVQVFNSKKELMMIMKEKTLLGKFHNIVVYYLQPSIETVLKLFNWSSMAQDEIIMFAKILIKILTVNAYLLYGLGGTAYISGAGFFFTLCFMIIAIKRYESLHKIIVHEVGHSVA
ncbi:hypothetical protein TBLA_0B01050 [Henningerozyma blattae CBS 6284]|uniref:Uncharacterized protein n=1 Tax=Henningerozyma blattae (strain ATCC 34711 / CBS 6284 / DSM 70876 / NBRC 10599 / NRRL Y-10934 / UCD 77-7) TaxID=1071380 RepID=I2GXU6_HENB6|nr:hypothetical protein TBLA_0B01050 [Tetrapisispora blattae CBS 6284]CCH58948.1 hypothetical protein TBLA_0B01050 [Tetrapisispora blattae CBS 6284]